MATDAQIKAEQANQVLNNPVFVKAFDNVVEGAIQGIADAPVEGAEIRNQLGLFIAAAQAFKAELFEFINTGKLEAQQDKDEAEGKTDED